MHEDRPSIRGKRRSGIRRAGVAFLFVFIGFWTMMTAIFDAFVINSLIRGEMAKTYPTTDGVVIESRVEEGIGSTRSGSYTTYSLHIRYRFEVAGQSYESTRYRYGEVSSGNRSRSQHLVDAHPPGSQVTVHYNAKDPHHAVLLVGADGLQFAMFAFMTPFNIVMFGGWSLLISLLYASMRRDVIAGIRIRSGATISARLLMIAPWMVGLGGAMAIAFPGAILLMIMSSIATSDREVVILMVSAYLSLTAAAGLMAYLIARHYVRRGDYDLVIDIPRNTIRIPQSPGIETRDLSLSQITALRTSNDPNRKINHGLYTAIYLHWNEANDEHSARLMSWPSERDAEEFRDWLAPLILKNDGLAPNHGTQTPTH